MLDGPRSLVRQEARDAIFSKKALLALKVKSSTPNPSSMLDEKAEYVSALFSGIPREYDQLLWMLTLRQDARWRKVAIRASGLTPPARILDLATGTGVFAYDWIDALGPGLSAVALDLTPAMLRHAARVRKDRGQNDPVSFVCGRTETLPFPNGHFDAASIGLALRNLSSLGASFSEMARVVRPGGRVLSIDFTRPPHPLFRRIYYLYLCRGLPAIGRAISPEWEQTFEYLWRSILNFKNVKEVLAIMENIGLKNVYARPLTGGIATLLAGTRP